MSIFAIFMLCVCALFSQSQNIFVTRSLKDSLYNEDNWQREKAISSPIIEKKIFPDCSDYYIEQHYYPNGLLFFQVPIINGKRNGMYIEYYSNGQLHYEIPVKDNVFVNDYCRKSSISYDYFGNVSSLTIYKIKQNKTYRFTLSNLTICEEPYYCLFIYLIKDGQHPKLISEYRYYDGIWDKAFFHTKPVWNSKHLLNIFLKELKSFNYDDYLNIGLLF